jgi:hypothetical protein
MSQKLKAVAWINLAGDGTLQDFAARHQLDCCDRAASEASEGEARRRRHELL